MKCTFCGNNVPEGSELCPECGMILSLDGDTDADISVPAFTPNVFGSEPIKTPEMPEGYEESAFSSEISVPEYNPENIAANNEPEEAMYDTAAEAPVAEVPSEADVPEETYEVPAYEPASFDDEPAEVYEAPAYGDDEVDASYSVQADEADDSEYESFADIQSEEPAPEESFTPYAEDDEAEQITPVIVPVEDAVPEATEATEADEPAAAADELPEADDDGDTYIKSGKKGRAGTVAVLCLLLVVLVVAGGYIMKKVFPGDGTTTTKPATPVIATGTDATTAPSTPDNETTAPEETTEPSATDDTTEADTTAPDVTEPSEELTTEPSTESTTEPSTESTTRPTTTKPTTRPSTTKPTTKPSTKPSSKPTTKPSTTVDPFGINDGAEIKKPSSYLSQSYIGYTSKKVDMLGAPSSSSDWVQSLGKGAEVKVLAQQSGYSYVYSTRFGTYGWVKSSSISDSRPVQATTSVSSDTVRPDKNGSGEIMYTAYSLNLRTGPSTSYDSIKIIPVNYQVKVIGYKSGVSGWAYVTDLVSGKNGWVSTDYLTDAE